MKRFLAALMVVILLFTVAIPKQQARAEPITITALSAAAFAMATAAGLSWVFSNGTSGDVQTLMENSLGNWTNSHGGMSIWGTTPVRAIAGKLAIAHQAYNNLKLFINSYISDNQITDTPTVISEGFAGNVQIGVRQTSYEKTTGLWCYLETNSGHVKESDNLPGYFKSTSYTSTWFPVQVGYGSNYQDVNGYGSYNVWTKPSGWMAEYVGNNQWKFTFYWSRTSNDLNSPEEQSTNVTITLNNAPLTTTGSATIPAGGMDYQTVNTGQEWVADVGAAPDTNLDQLIPEVFADVANNDLIISDDEVTTDTPSTPVPTSVPDTNVDQLIGNISSTVSDIAGTLEGVQEGVGEAVGQLEGINEGVGSISEALEVPTTSEASTFKFDLTTLFPFCIPFDIYRFVTMFNASPVAPHVQIPFNIPAVGLQYTFDLDFASFNTVASVLRSVELIAFCVGLAILTSKVIRW